MARARAPSQVAGPRQIWDLPTPVTAGELLLPFGPLARELAGRDVSSTFGRSRAVVIDPGSSTTPTFGPRGGCILTHQRGVGGEATQPDVEAVPGAAPRQQRIRDTHVASGSPVT